MGSGEYSWVGAVKSMQEIGVPEEAILDWCRRGSNFKSDKDVYKLLNEKPKPGKKSCIGSIIQDAKNHGWKPDPDKLTGEYKRNHERAERNREMWNERNTEQEERKKQLLAELGIEYRSELSFNYDINAHPELDLIGLTSAESILTVFDTETGEIIWKRDNGGNPGQIETTPAADGLNVHQAVQVQPEAPAGKKTIDEIILSYDGVEIRETNYLFFPWFPRGKLTAVQGDSSSGKSTFLYAVGAMVSTGGNILNVPCEDPGNVMFITLEDDESDILTAFLDAGGNRDRLFRMTREDIAKVKLTSNVIAILDEAIERKKLKFLVLDPIQAYIQGDMNKANDTRPQLASLASLAEKHNIVIAFIQHTGKDSGKSALHRGLGSVDIGAATRSLLQVVMDPEDTESRIMFTVKNNTAALRDVRQGIRYQICDHPQSNAHSSHRQHFHGHAEFIEIIPEYSEKTYRKALRKIDDEESDLEQLQLQLSYESDPLVKTVRELMQQNPTGVFLGADELIWCITDYCGHCPYTQTKDKSTGINERVRLIRNMMMERDSIQMDMVKDPVKAQPYRWNDEIVEPKTTRCRGIRIKKIKGKDDEQQMKV